MLISKKIISYYNTKFPCHIYKELYDGQKGETHKESWDLRG